MKVPFYLAQKFLFGKHRGLLGSSLTWIAIAGVFVSVLAFTIVYSGATGLSEDLVKKILGFSAHITLQNSDKLSSEDIRKIESNSNVTKVFSYLEGEAIIRTREAPAQGVQIRGIDEINSLASDTMKFFFPKGEGPESLHARGDKLPGIILGSELAENLGVTPSVGEKIELLFPLGEVGPTGDLEPTLRAFRIVGIFKSGYFDFDSKYVLIDRQQAQYLLGEQVRSKLGIFLSDPFRAQAFKEKNLVKLSVPSQTWMDQHSKLFRALKLDRLGIGVILGIMMLLAAFNIFSLMMMLVHEHRQEIAVLKALGLPQKSITRLFYQAGLGVGLIGSSLGLGVGVIIATLLQRSAIPLPSPYYLDVFPFKINWLVLGLVFFVSLLIGLAATLFPAAAASRFQVVEILRKDS